MERIWGVEEVRGTGDDIIWVTVGERVFDRVEGQDLIKQLQGQVAAGLQLLGRAFLAPGQPPSEVLILLNYLYRYQ